MSSKLKETYGHLGSDGADISRFQGDFLKAVIGNDPEQAAQALRNVVKTCMGYELPVGTENTQLLAHAAHIVADSFSVAATSKENGFSKLPLMDEGHEQIMERVMHSGLGSTDQIGRAASAMEQIVVWLR